MSGGSACRNLRQDLRGRSDAETGCRSIEGDAGGTGQVRAQDSDHLSGRGGGGQHFDERSKSDRKAEDRPTPLPENITGSRTAVPSCSVKIAVRGLHEPGVRYLAVETALAAKDVKRGKGTRRGKSKHGPPAIPAPGCCPVEVPIRGLDERALRPRSVTKIEAMKGREDAAGGDLENGAAANIVLKLIWACIGAAIEGRSIKVTINGLNQGAGDLVRGTQGVQRR